MEFLIYEKRGEEEEVKEKGRQGPAKRPKFAAAENRHAWVKGSVAEAVRREGGVHCTATRQDGEGATNRVAAEALATAGGTAAAISGMAIVRRTSERPQLYSSSRGRGYGSPRGPHRGRGRPCTAKTKCRKFKL
jgi:hypothetical protein